MISQTVKINILGKDYDVAYPLPGQMLAIESLKLALTGGQYGVLAKSRHDTALTLLDIVDAFSNFTVMVPELAKVFTVNYFNNISPLDSAKLTKAFGEYFVFLSKTEMEIQKILNPETDKNNQDGKPGL